MKVAVCLPLILSMFQLAWPQVEKEARQEAVELARQVLASRLRVTNEIELQLMSAMATNWPDTSLGCPREGYFYTQVIIPGYRVLFKNGERELGVNVGNGRAVVCDSEPAGFAYKDAMARELARSAREDLAKALGVEPSELNLLRLRKSLPGEVCRSGESERMATADGYMLWLEFRRETYRYFGDVQGILLCADSL